MTSGGLTRALKRDPATRSMKVGRGVNVEGSNVKVVYIHAIKNDILPLCALCDTLPSHYEHVSNMLTCS